MFYVSVRWYIEQQEGVTTFIVQPCVVKWQMNLDNLILQDSDKGQYMSCYTKNIPTEGIDPQQHIAVCLNYLPILRANCI